VTFLRNIFARLQSSAGSPVLREIRDGQFVTVTGAEFLALVQQARNFLATRGLKKGERCALIAPNSIRWAAMDLAMMVEGIIVVPLYARQAPSHIFCLEDSIASEIRKIWPEAQQITSLENAFDSGTASRVQSFDHMDSDPVTIIYTSGTSGEPKGVVLTVANVNHMLGCTNMRLDQLMRNRNQPDRVFHYLPFCFAGSWILLLTALSRNSVLTLSTDLSKLSDE
jgi:long-chain acyl-CoA synthetase